MLEVFLSASIPLPERNRHYFETADTLAIREAIKALVEYVLPIGRITCGGHPTITPLLDFFAHEADLSRDRVTIFQSRFFRDSWPNELARFHDVKQIDDVPGDREGSLSKMRTAMISSRKFDAAVFVGGMEGILAEANLVRQLQPKASIIPLASTGAAAADLYREGEYISDFMTDVTYATVFRHHIDRRKD